MTKPQIDTQLIQLSHVLILLSSAPAAEIARKLPEVRGILDDLWAEAERLRDLDEQTRGQT